MLQKFAYRLSRFGILALVLLGLAALAMRQGWFMGIQNSLQNKFYDQNSASSEIIIAAIDEKSLSAQHLGPLRQWPRAHYAQAIRQLNEDGAAAVGIDITFPDPSAYSAEDDAELQAALEAYPNTVLAARYYFEGKARKAEWPNANLNPSNSQLGWINVQLDRDGFVRKLPLFAESEKGVVEAFSVALARQYLKAEPAGYALRQGNFPFGEGRSIPAIEQKDPESQELLYSMRINYFAAPYQFRHISFSDLLEGRWVDKDGQAIDFADKIVIIGPTAIDLQDSYLSPVSEGVKMPGAEIHANALQTIIEGKFLREQSALSLWLTLLILALANIGLFSFLRVRYALPLLVAEEVGLLIAGIVAYEWRLLINVIYPMLMVAGAFAGTYVTRFILEQRQRKFIEGAFGHYVNKAIVRQIQQHPETLALGGVRREVSVYFSDIAGFTGISEQMSPTELVAFLNEYLGEMTEIVLKQDGTLDKYIGDAIMAFWNAPLAQHEHALKACLAALESQEKLERLREKWKAEGKPEMRVRIGLNTGEAVVGNMGSKNRFSYTAMGDNVNLGSRLEGVNKFYGTYILMADAIYEKVKEVLLCRELDLIRVKGRQEPVRIYELQGRLDSIPAKLAALNEAFAQALQAYRQGDFSVALALFENLKKDPPSQTFAQRCRDFIKNPPPADWGGVWTFEEK